MLRDVGNGPCLVIEASKSLRQLRVGAALLLRYCRVRLLVLLNISEGDRSGLGEVDANMKGGMTVFRRARSRKQESSQ